VRGQQSFTHQANNRKRDQRIYKLRALFIHILNAHPLFCPLCQSCESSVQYRVRIHLYDGEFTWQRSSLTWSLKPSLMPETGCPESWPKCKVSALLAGAKRTGNGENTIPGAPLDHEGRVIEAVCTACTREGMPFARAAPAKCAIDCTVWRASVRARQAEHLPLDPLQLLPQLPIPQIRQLVPRNRAGHRGRLRVGAALRLCKRALRSRPSGPQHATT
jgi:hypothetical protein